jgi:hypothetical protein
VIDALASQFHDTDRVLVDAAVRVAQLRLGRWPNANNLSAALEHGALLVCAYSRRGTQRPVSVNAAKLSIGGVSRVV